MLATHEPTIRHHWRPLLDGVESARALDVVDEIAATLGDERTASPDPTLAGGKAGWALLLAYAGRALDVRAHRAAALRRLDEASEAAAALPLGLSLYSGIAGIALCRSHLMRRFHGSDDPSSAALDGALTARLAEAPWRSTYDVVAGLGGVALYALERAAHAVSGQQLLAIAVARLAELADADGRWRTVAAWVPASRAAAHPEGYVDLGVAHGVAGALAVLGACDGVQALTAAHRALVERAVDWLLARQLPDGALRFPQWISPTEAPARARLGWCYGDLGIACALDGVAASLGRADWRAAARDLARRAAAVPSDESGVVDAGLCHGAAGVAHLFARLHQRHGDELFAGAARAWYARALAMPASDAPGFLGGAAGVGLALLSAATDVAPDWDVALALSTPRTQEQP